MGTVGAEPFSAKLRYTGADDPEHPNLIKVAVTMPHIDGRWELQAGRVDEWNVCNTQVGGCSRRAVLARLYQPAAQPPAHLLLNILFSLFN